MKLKSCSVTGRTKVSRKKLNLRYIWVKCSQECGIYTLCKKRPTRVHSTREMGGKSDPCQCAHTKVGWGDEIINGSWECEPTVCLRNWNVLLFLKQSSGQWEGTSLELQSTKLKALRSADHVHYVKQRTTGGTFSKSNDCEMDSDQWKFSSPIYFFVFAKFQVLSFKFFNVKWSSHWQWRS